MWDLVISLLASIFGLLDRLIAWVIDEAYKLLMIISDTNLFSSNAIEEFGERIYVLIGIFMLFKLTFSLVNYLINPDDFSSKEKGGTKLVTNVMLVLLFIPTFPFLFKQAYELQGMLLKNHVLDRIILGVSSTSVEENDEIGSLSFEVFTAFFQPNTKIEKMKSCENLYASPVDINTNKINVSPDCLNAINSIVGSGSGEIVEKAINEKDISELFTWKFISAKENGEFVFNYNFLISTITGAIVAVIMINFCIDAAVRSVKLGFLQLIAPIPILSYVDPKSSKDGVFKRWLTTVIKTYLDLFIRLAAIFFAIFVISLVSKYDIQRISTGETITFGNHPFVKIFIILGALIFAKQLPKLISDITGMKFDGGDFSLNPMKKISSSPFAAAAVGGVAGVVGGAAANAAAWYYNRESIGENIAEARAKFNNAEGFEKFKAGRDLFCTALSPTVGSVIAGGFSAGTRGVAGGLKSDGKASALGIAKKSVEASNEARNRRATIAELNRAATDDKGKIDWKTRNITEPIKKAAGVKNKYGNYGELDKRSKMLARQISNLEMQEEGLRKEYSNLVMEGIKTGVYKYDDYEFAIKGIPVTQKIDGEEVKVTVYDYDQYKQEIENENKTRLAQGQEQLEILDKKTYEEATGLQKAIQNIDETTEKLKKQQKRIDSAISSGDGNKGK